MCTYACFPSSQMLLNLTGWMVPLICNPRLNHALEMQYFDWSDHTLDVVYIYFFLHLKDKMSLDCFLKKIA